MKHLDALRREAVLDQLLAHRRAAHQQQLELLIAPHFKHLVVDAHEGNLLRPRAASQKSQVQITTPVGLVAADAAVPGVILVAAWTAEIVVVDHADRTHTCGQAAESAHVGLMDEDGIRLHSADALFERLNRNTLFKLRLVLRNLPARYLVECEEALMAAFAQPRRRIGDTLLDATEVSAFLIYEENSHESPHHRSSPGVW